MLFHTISPEDWATFDDKSHYEAESLHTEGFIHCSTDAQLLGVVERFYGSVDNLLALHIDETLLDCELKYEPAPGTDERYPHVFGPIVKTAIVNVVVIKADGVVVDGYF
jgi:uncharacterized protein (DUF952 family)